VSRETKPRLGRGLEALIPKTFFASGKSIIQVPIDEIRPNPYQPRKRFDEEKLKSLAASITRHGLAQPIVLRKVEFHYELVAGERRYRASVLAGLPTISAIIREMSDEDSVQIALVENLEREDLNAIEVAKGYDQLISDFAYTHQTISTIFGRSRSSVTNTLRLLNLPRECQEAIMGGDLTEGHARAILALKDKGEMLHYFHMLKRDGVNVREFERRVSEAKAKAKGNPPKKESGRLRELSEEMTSVLAVPVKIFGSENKGRLEIRFSDENEFKSILSRLSGRG
jgi:ParB family chromosome partitioning protein